MPPKSKTHARKAQVTQLAESAQERAIREVYQLYMKPVPEQNCGEIGLEEIAKELEYSIHIPRQKATVLLLGNHSSGKSSFVNWYIGENVLPTGAAVETRGFTIVTSGNKASPPIKGEGTLRYFSQLQEISKFGSGLMDNLTTLISVSQSRSFNSIDFIDTPGLVDGSMEYPFDVNGVLLYLADYVDMILVFMDPHEQALGSRTMKVVEMLNKNHSNKMRYYLTKIDTIESPRDLIKITSQLTQSLIPHIKSTHGWSIPTIYLPHHSVVSNANNMNVPAEDNGIMSEFNMINDLCNDMDTVIQQKIQENLMLLKEDASCLMKKNTKKINRTERLRSVHKNLIGWIIVLILVLIPLFCCYLCSMLPYISGMMNSVLSDSYMEYLNNTITKVNELKLPYLFDVNSNIAGYTLLGLFAIIAILIFINSFINSKSLKEKQQLYYTYEDSLLNMLKRREELYNKFITNTFKPSH